ncbi:MULTISPECIES: ABC transporter substrate-binding protein [unclassified Bradyrhizobium]|uniref:ABC transporter substrate-binding protein n=1 Tax=unclassified Bradyrhizobium TaxID=2631580 RepID=UPI0024788C9B|nr:MULTISPECIES: ABC transporter substrate-binding protein [unclassified Bradyrhizobium]WGR73302.1 ABC transporter substrate-binding protein [Bradyrhizobium sp. ISRA426]WGR78139.1 ABC transporter substrate-binding protein [Bradyrhizobium sp. ISRA430]WGR88540.1 ABC transporter substrate-binding protein [Bradyrhizobium sp. ISRA432]
MRRLACLAFALWAFGLSAGAHEQQASRSYRIGYLGFGALTSTLREVFERELRDLGWIEGQNIFIDYRFADGDRDRLPGLAAELVKLKADVVVASPTPAAQAARNVTQAIPIVGIGLDNPVRHGLIASLAQPGGNVTGLSYSDGPEIFRKDLSLLHEMAPNIRHVAVLSNSASPNHLVAMENIEAAAKSLGLELLLLDVDAPDRFEIAFATMARERVQALFVFGDPMFSVYRFRLAELSVQYRLPTVYTNRPHVDAGGLMCYGPSFPELWRRAAAYVDKILRGAKPADLPVEQPVTYELVINLKTAKALGVEVPPTLLVQADAVIE